MDRKIKIGLLGLGTVGTGVVKVLNNFDNVEIKKIAVRNLNKTRDIDGLDKSILTDNPADVVNDPEIDILVEVVGGIDPVFDLLKTAIINGKHIVTANKELLAKKGEELFELAKKHNRVILFEAAVAGGVPLLMPLKQSLAANKVTKVAGILNGTTNYILTQMESEGREFQDVLEEAQKLGYAEADPTGDIQGYDASYKIAIISSLAFGKRIDITRIFREGIDKISPVDIEFAAEFGYRIKLIALGQVAADNSIDVRVHPMFVRKSHPMAHVSNSSNAVEVECSAAGKVMFSGSGAGELPTASAVVGDILAIANELNVTDLPLPVMRCKHDSRADQLDVSDTMNKYYIRVSASNIPGVIGELGQICGKNHINLYSVVQKGISKDGSATIVLLTELAYEKNIQNAIKEIAEGSTVHKVENVIRVME